jgi:PAS domain S-box-containing protein
MWRDAARQTIPRSVRQWCLAGLGLVASALAVAFLVVNQSRDAVVVLATVVPAIALLVYGAWFGFQGPNAARGSVVFGWAIAGAVVVLVFDAWALEVGAYGESVWVDHVLLQHTATGALAGSIVGTYGERDHWRERSHSRLRRALDAAMDGVAVLDEAGYVTYANDAFHDYYGVDNESLVDEHWEVCYPAESREHIADAVDNLDENGSAYWHGTVVARRADDRTYPQELSLTKLDAGGFVLVCRDVTGRKKQSQRLQVLNRVLRHNVRNSLNVVLGRAQRLADRHGESEDVESIVDAAQDVLDTSEKARLVERAFEDTESTLREFESLVEEAVAEARSKHPETAFEATIECEADVDATIRFAVQELLENAAEHNDADDPSVQLTVEPDLTCHVSDNGSGIPHHERQALEGSEETQLEHASGIGLWLVYWLVNQQNGSVEVTEDGGVIVHLDPGKN